ncbi:MAG: hypothetical protein EBR51_00035 [Gammaproteobacteria bacterium]|nr:hypothetical protein [Gammaproteobacteria bacterium]
MYSMEEIMKNLERLKEDTFPKSDDARFAHLVSLASLLVRLHDEEIIVLRVNDHEIGRNKTNTIGIHELIVVNPTVWLKYMDTWEEQNISSMKEHEPDQYVLKLFENMQLKVDKVYPSENFRTYGERFVTTKLLVYNFHCMWDDCQEVIKQQGGMWPQIPFTTKELLDKLEAARADIQKLRDTETQLRRKLNQVRNERDRMYHKVYVHVTRDPHGTVARDFPELLCAIPGNSKDPTQGSPKRKRTGDGGAGAA